MHNVNANVIFYMIFHFISKENLKRNLFYLLRRTPSPIFFKDSAQNLSTQFSSTPLNGCFQNSLLDISNFLLGFVKAICRKFYLCTTEATYTRDILLPDIVLSVLQFFQFYLILPIFTPPNLNLFSTSTFFEI